ncbi:MAG: PilZ domain-containing protein [Planctomycetaceae bacterium]|nr:PilZ domain-containing protein [Planctomycetaceae bacterium]
MTTHDTPFVAAEFVPVRTTDLQIGAAVASPIYDQTGRLLVGAGQKLTLGAYQHLCQRGIDRLLVHRKDISSLLAGRPEGQLVSIPSPGESGKAPEENELTLELDADRVVETFVAGIASGKPHRDDRGKPTDGSYDMDLRHSLIEARESSIARLEQTHASAMEAGQIDVDAVSAITEQTLDGLVEDSDLFAALGLNPMGTGYPARHSLHSCMVALNIGFNLGLDKLQLRELALGTLIHDAGMLKIDRGIWTQTERLTSAQRLELMKHPVRVFDLVWSLKRIPRRSAFIAYQIHERIDGSGYPRQRSGDQIHFFSKVAAVADVYAALVANRPHRQGILPARAIEHVIEEAVKRRLDLQAVCALLETTSLYPLGSAVILNDGRVARTLRGNQLDFERPVIQAWRRSELNTPGEVIDLATTNDLFIVRAIPNLTISDGDLVLAMQLPNLAPASLATLLNLAGRYQSGGKIMMRAPRVAIDRGVKLIHASDDRREWRTRTVRGRDVSRTGIGVVDSGSPLPAEVIVILENPGSAPVFILGKVVRSVPLADGSQEYGIQFVRKLDELPRTPGGGPA